MRLSRILVLWVALAALALTACTNEGLADDGDAA